MRRQMELMTLVERNTLSKTAQQAMSQRSGNPSHLQHHSSSALQKVSKFSTSNVVEYDRSDVEEDVKLSNVCFRMRIHIECSLPVKGKLSHIIKPSDVILPRLA